MEKINDGGPAFPRNGRSGSFEDAQEGMTLRDYYADAMLRARGAA